MPRDHPRRRIKAVSDATLAQLLPTFDATVFTKNRQRLLVHDAGRALFDKAVWAADQGELLSDAHFSMDGTPERSGRQPRSFRPKKEPTHPSTDNNPGNLVTTAYNPESMVNLKAAPETVDRTARVTY